MDLFGGPEMPEIDYQSLYDDYSSWRGNINDNREFERDLLNQKVNAAIVRGHSQNSDYIRNLLEQGNQAIDESYNTSLNTLQQGVTYQTLVSRAGAGIATANRELGATVDPMDNLGGQQPIFAGEEQAGPMGTSRTYEAGDTIAGPMGTNRTVEARPDKVFQTENEQGEMVNDPDAWLDETFGGGQSTSLNYDAPSAGNFEDEFINYTAGGQSQLGGA